MADKETEGEAPPVNQVVLFPSSEKKVHMTDGRRFYLTQRSEPVTWPSDGCLHALPNLTSTGHGVTLQSMDVAAIARAKKAAKKMKKKKKKKGEPCCCDAGENLSERGGEEIDH